MFNEGFQFNLWQEQASLLSLKGMVSCISRTVQFLAQKVSKKVWLIHESYSKLIAKINTLFVTKTTKKPYPLGPHIPI